MVGNPDQFYLLTFCEHSAISKNLRMQLKIITSVDFFFLINWQVELLYYMVLAIDLSVLAHKEKYKSGEAVRESLRSRQNQ